VAIEWLMAMTPMDLVVSHMAGVQGALDVVQETVYEKAKANLAEARASTTHSKIIGPSHLTKITKSKGEVDRFVNMEAPNPMSIEFGHAPSGYFDPEKYGKITKAPMGLYILTKASGVGGM
jgi:hypothetical protein